MPDDATVGRRDAVMCLIDDYRTIPARVGSGQPLLLRERLDRYDRDGRLPASKEPSLLIEIALYPCRPFYLV